MTMQSVSIDPKRLTRKVTQQFLNRVQIICTQFDWSFKDQTSGRVAMSGPKELIEKLMVMENGLLLFGTPSEIAQYRTKALQTQATAVSLPIWPPHIFVSGTDEEQ